jgi:putative Mn2+ efflux pump MntP
MEKLINNFALILTTYYALVILILMGVYLFKNALQPRPKAERILAMVTAYFHLVVVAAAIYTVSRLWGQ